MAVRISVVIPHLNQPDGLAACLRSLEAQTLDRDLFEMIVVDNGSPVLPRDIIARHPGVRLLEERQPGPGPARNTGAAAAKADLIAFIDADCRAHPDWLAAVLRAFERAPGGTILGGEVRIWALNKSALTPIEAYECVFGFRNKLYVTKHGYSITANLAVRRADIEKIGPFPGIQFAEDMQWGELATKAGYHFRYARDMIVYHPARRSLQELYVKWDRQLLHYRNMAEANRGWRLRWIARSLLVLGSPVVDSIRVLASDRIEGISARLDAIAVLCAVRLHRAVKMLILLRSHRSMVWNR